MANTHKSQRVIIIGAGIVGVNLADELIQRGWKDITVVEQGPLAIPGGSTSHAPGLVFQTNPSRTMTKLAKYTVEKLLGLECFNQVGGLEIATTNERVEELKRKKGWAESWGIENTRLLTPSQCKQMYPHLNKATVKAGFFIPSDGLALAAQAVQLLMQRTQQAGVLYLDKTPVTGIAQSNDRVTGVETPKGTVTADIVISCAGFWGVEIGKMVDLPIPLLPLAHQYVKTSAVPALAGSGNEKPNGAQLPILRHQDQDLYYREHGDRFGIGYYGHKAMPVVAADLGLTPEQVNEKNMPSRLQFTAEDFAPAWKESQNFLPGLKQTEIQDGFNGIFSFTPDGGPLVGPHPTLSGFWVCEAIWVTHSAGSARAMAEILTQGYSSIDISECELSRFDEIESSRSYVEETSKASFDGVYDIHHPQATRSSPRDLRVSPFFAAQKHLGASFGDDGTWEVPLFYSANASLLGRLPQSSRHAKPSDEWAARYDSPVPAIEAHKVQETVGMYDLTSQRSIIVQGVNAADFLDRLSTADVPSMEAQEIREALLLHPNGGIRDHITITKLSGSRVFFQVDVSSHNTLVYLQREAWRMYGSNLIVQDNTSSTCRIGLSGPRAIDVLRTVTGVPELKILQAGNRISLYIGAIPITITRTLTSSTWLIQANVSTGQTLWSTIYSAVQAADGLAIGSTALNALRICNGIPKIGRDVGSEHTPYAAGLQHLVSQNKSGDFMGKATALRATPQTPEKPRLRSLVLNDGDDVVMGAEPVYLPHQPQQAVGYVSSAAFGYNVGRCVGLAWLPGDVKEGQGVEIEYFSRRIAGTVATAPITKKDAASHEEGWKVTSSEPREMVQMVAKARL